jgi:quinol monooxygenase YgiN
MEQINMIVVNGIVKASPEDIEHLTTAIAAMETASRAEPGCRDYTFSVELNDGATLRVTELWDSLEALQAHFQTPHMAAFQQAIAARPPQSTDIKFFQAEEISLG